MSIEHTLEEQAEVATFLRSVRLAVRQVATASEQLEGAVCEFATCEDLGSETVLCASASNLVHHLYLQYAALLEALEEVAQADAPPPPRAPLFVPGAPRAAVRQQPIGALFQAN